MERYYVVIVLTFFGFVALAAILLVPVYLFLKREEEVASHWTDEKIAELSRTPPESDESVDGSDDGVNVTDDAQSRPG